MAQGALMRSILLLALTSCMTSSVHGDPGGGGSYNDLGFDMRCVVQLVCPQNNSEEPDVMVLYDEKLCIEANGIDTADTRPFENRLRDELCHYPTCVCTAFCKPAGINNYCVGPVSLDEVP